MNPNHPTYDPADDEQAALWAARLEGALLTAADRSALDAWLAGDPVHRDLLTQYCQFSADLEPKLAVLVAADAVDLPPALARRLPRWGAWAAGVTLAAAAVATVVLWPGRDLAQHENRATPVAQRQALTLADGTRVELNAQTNLQIDLTARSRHVLLAAGEAFFTVSKDPSRPFIVETPAGSVRVTGTRFNVRAEAGAPFEVTVLEGSVQAHPGGPNGQSAAPRSLRAGDQLTAGPAGVAVRQLAPSALEDALAWRQGQVVFDGVPLSDALARFARFHGCGIHVTPDAAGRLVGGRYSLDDLDGFLNFIAEGLKVRVTRDLNGTIQVSARPAP